MFDVLDRAEHLRRRARQITWQADTARTQGRVDVAARLYRLADELRDIADGMATR